MKTGNIDIVNPKIGSVYIEKVYSGSDLVYERTFTTLLDGLTGSTGGFSLRQLNSSYTGSAIQVRRSSDNTTQDIGFINNELDTASLTSFCTGTDGFVTIWYNQSDTNNNAIQTVASNQPKIYEASTGVQTENGKPAIVFDIGDFLEVLDTSYGHIDESISVFGVVKLDSSNNFFSTITSKGYREQGAYTVGGAGTRRYQVWVEEQQLISTTVLDSNQNLLSTTVQTGTNGLKMYLNSSLVDQFNITGDLIGSNSFKFTIGRNDKDNNYYWQGTMQEILMFDNDQTVNKTTIETDINNFYRIY